MIRVFSTHHLPMKRGKLQARQAIRLSPVEDALDGDGFRKSKGAYEWLCSVTPRFDPALDADIQWLLHRYELETGIAIPPATYSLGSKQGWRLRWRMRKQGSTKRERLQAVLWIVERLPAAQSDHEAINQVACVLERVDALAWRRVPGLGSVRESDISIHGMRLPEPQPEAVLGHPIQASFGIRHVTLFSPTGAIQVQCLPENDGAVNYAQRARIPGIVLLDKPDAQGHTLWLSRNL
jgi:hypothetical protein